MTSLGKMDFAAKWETVLAETETVEEVGNGTTSGGTVARCLLVVVCFVLRTLGELPRDGMQSIWAFPSA